MIQKDVEERLRRLGFRKDKLGYIVYKTFGLYYMPMKRWVIEEDSYITHGRPNRNEQAECGCGINFATRGWVNNEVCTWGYHFPRQDKELWRCRIRFEDLDKVVVPDGSDGKARCGRLELLKVVKRYK